MRSCVRFISFTHEILLAICCAIYPVTKTTTTSSTFDAISLIAPFSISKFGTFERRAVEQWLGFYLLNRVCSRSYSLFLSMVLWLSTKSSSIFISFFFIFFFWFFRKCFRRRTTVITTNLNTEIFRLFLAFFHRLYVAASSTSGHVFLHLHIVRI